MKTSNMIDEPQKREYFECSCTDMEHMFRLTHYADDDIGEGDLYMSFYLYSYSSFLKRVWTGVKYMFGYRSRYGEFGEIILDENTVTKLHNYLEGYLADRKAAEADNADTKKATNTEQ